MCDAETKCSRCSNYLKRKLHCRKQRQIKNLIEQDKNVRIYTTYDEQIIVPQGEDKCSAKRPDFSWDCGTHHVVLVVDEAVDPVALGEAFEHPISMLPGALGQVARHADVEHAVRTAGGDVDVEDLCAVLMHVGSCHRRDG